MNNQKCRRNYIIACTDCCYNLSEGIAVKFNFDWNYVAAGAPYVTISEFALGFNSASVSMLGNPEKVIIGFDEKACAIGIKAYENEESIKAFDFHDRIKNGWVRIGCKDFIRNLSVLTGKSFSPAVRYVAKYDAEDKVLFISLLEGELDA